MKPSQVPFFAEPFDLAETQGMNTELFAHSPPRERPPRVLNRVAAFMIHIPWYGCKGVQHLSEDSGIAKSAIRNLIIGVGQPNFSTLMRLTEAFSYRMGRPLDIREVAITEGMIFPTEYPCELFGCSCLPPWIDSGQGTVLPEFRNFRSGKWNWSGPVHKLEW